MKFIDSHCHIHDSEFFLENREQVYDRAVQSAVGMIVIGTDERSSQEAVGFARNHETVWAAIGVHPHESKLGHAKIEQLLSENSTASDSKIVGVGEIGLDYYYNHSPRDTQIKALEAQMQLALDYNLPISFHVREAFDDFWPIFDNFHGIRGVVHSFTDTPFNATQALNRGLYIGVSGFSTFTKDEMQKNMFSSIPLDKTLLETDAPYLTPVPFRGKVNEPAYVRNIAENQAAIRKISFNEIADATTNNATVLFNL